MQKHLLFTLLFLPGMLLAYHSDTLIISSKVFGQDRQVIVHTPEEVKYQSERVKLPVFYVLDGQHEWFVNPVLNNFQYLQYTHEIPKAIIVTIPHVDRNRECAISEIEGPVLPLHQFITTEVEEVIRKYNPNDFRLIIGHSFSSSFALYSFHRGNGFYAAVFAHSPFDQFENLVVALSDNTTINPAGVFISVGSIDADKDKYHRVVFNEVKTAYPAFFSKINIFEANESTHNAVPIVANPLFLNKLFYRFSRRFGQIAQVDPNYKLVAVPDSPSEEIQKVNDAAKIGDSFYPPEIAEIFGLASRYLNSGYDEQAIAVYEMGATYYPNLYDLYVSLYDLYLERDKSTAKKYLLKAYQLLDEVEKGEPEAEDLLKEIAEEIAKNGW